MGVDKNGVNLRVQDLNGGPGETSAEIAAAAERDAEVEHSTSILEAIRKYPKAVFWAIAISMTIVMEGYDTNLLNNLYAYPSFTQKYGTFHPELKEYVISTAWQNGLSCGYYLGSFMGLGINGIVTEKFGHRIVIMGGLVMMCAVIFATFFAPSIEVLLVGEILFGIPSGMFGTMGSIYASEVCPLALRGFLISFVNLCWVIGQFVSAGVLQGLVTNATQWSYRIPFGVQWAWPVPLFIIAYFAPDSPWWLIRKGKLEKAQKSLTRLSSNLSEDELRLKLAMMVHTDNLEKDLDTKSSYKSCFIGTNLRRTEVACVTLSTQAICGQVLAYSNTFFLAQAGLAPDNVYKLNLGSTALAFVGTIISWVLMAKWGRRNLIITGLVALTIDLLLIGILAYPAKKNPSVAWGQGALAIIWLAIYSCFIGPQTFALSAEVSATKLRAQTSSLARIAYYAFYLVCNVSETYLMNPTAANLQGRTGFIWFGTTFLNFVWAAFRLTETKDLTYEELDLLFEEKVPAWNFSRDHPILQVSRQREQKEEVEGADHMSRPLSNPV